MFYLSAVTLFLTFFVRLNEGNLQVVAFAPNCRINSRLHVCTSDYLSYVNKREIKSLPQIGCVGDSANEAEDNEKTSNNEDVSIYEQTNKGKKIRDKVKNIAKNLIMNPVIKSVAPQAIAEILTDATSEVVEMAVEEASKVRMKGDFGGLIRSRSISSILEMEAAMQGDTLVALDSIALAKTAVSDAFSMAESAIEDSEISLIKSKRALAKCKQEVYDAISQAEKAASKASASAARATDLITNSASDISNEDKEERNDINSTEEPSAGMDLTVDSESVTENFQSVSQVSSIINVAEDSIDVSELTYDDVDYEMSEMSPPFIGEDQCLVPGEAIVRVEKAPENSRRIFAGIDITASVEDVWNVLTDYQNLQKVVPNLVTNDVLEEFEAKDLDLFSYAINPEEKNEEQCRALSTMMKGAILKQVGGAKVVGINFSARTKLEVREWPEGIPDFFHYSDDVFEGESRTQRINNDKGQKLERYHFPRPFAISKLPTKDVSMQSLEDDDGEFRLYQGVWRMQPLPGCAGPDGSAMRLTYAVEISPRPYLPVALVERRISQDLCNNLRAIRDYVST